MKKFFLVGIFIFFSSTNLFAEYRLEPVTCTLKKVSNCGAYLYNSISGATYFCDSEKCKEVMPAIEESTTTMGGDKKSNKSKIPKFKKKKSKIPKFKKSE